MHRESPAAEKADITAYRYRPRRCLALPGVTLAANISQASDMLVSKRDISVLTDAICCLWQRL